MLHEKRTESRQADDDDGDAGFHVLPVDFPDDVDGALTGEVEADDLDDGDGHDDGGDAEGGAEEEFYARFDADFVQGCDGDGDDYSGGGEM